MRVHYLKHVPHEGLGSMETWFRDRGHALSCTELYRNPLPERIKDIDWLVVMGGPMGVYEEAQYPWLKAEKAFLAKVLERDIPVLGVCLGAQLVAEVLGATVTRNAYQEIGWFPVTLTPAAKKTALFSALPESFVPLHWHGDTFSLPPGAVHLARSEACEHQAFIHGDRVLGLQFHLEATPEVTAAFWEEDAPSLSASKYVQVGKTLLADGGRYAAMYPLMGRILERLESLAG